jgi:hypothetical protein
MNYTKIYTQIIDRAKIRAIIGYSEKHHIIPKCMGGNNDNENLVKLTAKEHFICHKLLCKMYPDNSKLKYAVWAMCRQRKTNTRSYNISSREYDFLRTEAFKNGLSIEIRQKMSNSKKGKPGRPHSNLTKNKLREYAKIQFQDGMSVETKQKISNTLKSKHIVPWNKGLQTTLESKEKISKKLKGRISNRKGCTLSEEQKRKMSESLKLAWQKRKTKKL